MSSCFFESSRSGSQDRYSPSASEPAASFKSRRSSSTLIRNSYVISEIKGRKYQQPISTSSNMLKVALLVIGVIAFIYLIDKAYANGRAAGYDAGMATGRAAGYDAGYATGRKVGEGLGKGQAEIAGYTEGHAAGREVGYRAGHSHGSKEGRDVGYKSGYEMGKIDANIACIDKKSAEFQRGIAEGKKQAENSWMDHYIEPRKPYPYETF